MLLEIVCDSYLNNIFYYVKNILNIIMIVVPILLIVFGTYSFFRLTQNPDEKNGLKKVRNQFIAAGIVFFLPIIVNAVMGMLGDNNSVSNCWINAKEVEESSYYDIDGDSRKKFTYDATKYEQGVGGTLDFTCTSSTVKAQFSCETLSIVEKHLNDFDATNFNSVIDSYGGFDSYAKNVGGIFGEYYGKKMPNVTVSDFQRAAEYVLGWMYMYGWDYMNSGGRHVKWTGADAFYSKGGFTGKYISDQHTSGLGTDFDHVISGQNGGVGHMASECGDLEVFTFNKLGIPRKKKLEKVTRLRDLKVGDCIYFGRGAKWDKLNEKTWKTPTGGHNVVVGEVYADHIVIYDGGSYFQYHKNYKREVYFPAENSESAEDKLLLSTFGFDSWGVRRWYEFEER